MYVLRRAFAKFLTLDGIVHYVAFMQNGLESLGCAHNSMHMQ